ncbi:Holliday junction ATP-dependent DNA helicase RuvB [compost metagenome]
MANRPLCFSDYIGQERMKNQLAVTIGAAKRNGKALPHILISGNPGLGKTTVAKIIANEFGTDFFEVMASNLTCANDVEIALAQLDNDMPSILFIDEIHRLPIKIEELFYPVMEDFMFETNTGGHDGKSTERLWVPKFTLIGATTLAGDLSRPLRDRFGIHFQLQNYQIDEIARIVVNLAEREEINIEKAAAYEIALRSKGVARLAVNYLNRCREYADFMNEDGIVSYDVVTEQFSLMAIDEIGLDENDYRVLNYLATQSRPVGLSALATGVDIDIPTITNIIEPYLVQKGLVNRTRGGREITERGLKWINNEPAEGVSTEATTYSTTDVRRVGRRNV